MMVIKKIINVDDMDSTFSTTTLDEAEAFSAITSSAGTACADAVAASTFSAGSIMDALFVDGLLQSLRFFPVT